MYQVPTQRRRDFPARGDTRKDMHYIEAEACISKFEDEAEKGVTNWPLAVSAIVHALLAQGSVVQDRY